MAKLSDTIATAADFELLLATAKTKANGSREEDFLAQLEDRYGTWGMNTFISDAQDRWLTDIARRN